MYIFFLEAYSTLLLHLHRIQPNLFPPPPLTLRLDMPWHLTLTSPLASPSAASRSPPFWPLFVLLLPLLLGIASLRNATFSIFSARSTLLGVSLPSHHVSLRDTPFLTNDTHVTFLLADISNKHPPTLEDLGSLTLPPPSPYHSLAYLL